jgi:ferredoxin-type protein NapH
VIAVHREAGVDAGAVATPPFRRLKRNRLLRIGVFIVGVSMFYAPFAFFTRLASSLFPLAPAANTVADGHTICLRMPISWIVQPWLWGSIGVNPVYFFGLVVLPIVAVALGPLFCGWLCPAGGFIEHLSRLVPDRLKFDVHGRVPLAPMRYGFFAGLLLAPFVTDSICCAFCNFGQMQNIVSLGTGNLSGFLYVSTTTMFTLIVWLLPLGLFIRGGRGWCNFLCPAGALQNLASAATGQMPFVARVRHDASKCTRCTTCEKLCPPRAVTVRVGEKLAVSPHVCNVCLDCVKACPSGALRYGRRG